MPAKGQTLTEEQRDKIRESKKNLTPEQRERIASAQRGKTISEETRLKMSAAHKGHPVSKEARDAIGNAHRGKVQPPEAIEKMRQSKIGNKDSEETRLKKSIAHMGEKNSFYGKHHSEETLKKITGRPFSQEHKLHLSESKLGKVPANIDILKTSRIGSINSEEHRKIVSEALTGITRSEESKELNRLAHMGIFPSDEAREKNRISHIGEKNHAWRGGISPLYESVRSTSKYLDWRDAVYKRDNYTDVITGEKGNGNLNAHHIVPFAEIMRKNNITTLEEAFACAELWDVNNGITMIDKNHIAYHARTNTPE